MTVDAWGVAVDGHVLVPIHRGRRKTAERMARFLKGVVVPLYQARQAEPPAAWAVIGGGRHVQKGEEERLVVFVSHAAAETHRGAHGLIVPLYRDPQAWVEQVGRAFDNKTP